MLKARAGESVGELVDILYTTSAVISEHRHNNTQKMRENTISSRVSSRLSTRTTVRQHDANTPCNANVFGDRNQ